MKDKMATTQSDDVAMEEGSLGDDGAGVDDGPTRVRKRTPYKDDDLIPDLSWPELVAQLLYDKQVATSLSSQGIHSFHLSRLVGDALKEAAKSLPSQHDLMGHLLTESLDLPDPDPAEEEDFFEEVLTPPDLDESQRKSINLVGRLFGPHRLVLLAIEGVTGVNINIRGSADLANNRRVSPGDKFHVKLNVRDTPTRARLRLDCAQSDVARLWKLPPFGDDQDEVRIRQLRLAKILSGKYNPDEDEVDRLENIGEESRIREVYESNLNLPEATGEEKVSFQAKVPLPPNVGGVDWIARIVKRRIAKTLSVKTGCQVELKEDGGGKGKDAAFLEIQANDEPDRATARLKLCMAEAKRMFVEDAEEGDDSAGKESAATGAEMKKNERSEERKKALSRIPQFLAKAKAFSTTAGATAAANAEEGILGLPPPSVGFGGGPPAPLMMNHRHSSPHDAVGPIRTVGHGKGHRFNPVGQPSSGGVPSYATSYGGGLDASMGGVPSGRRNEAVFVYNLGPDATEVDLYGLFGKFGAIYKVDIPKHKDGKSRGYGFVSFSDGDDAMCAVSGLDGYLFDKNGFKPLQVSFKTKGKSSDKGGGESEGRAEKKEALLQPTNQGNSLSLMGTGLGLPISSFGGSIGGSGGGGGGGGGYSSYSSSYPSAYPSSYSSSYPYSAMDYDLPSSMSSSMSYPFQVFIYNIGDEATELDLYGLCSPYGPVSRVNVIKDPGNDKPKGFAFVTFNDYDSACNAIQNLNGHPYPKNKYKKLQVSFKTESKSK